MSELPTATPGLEKLDEDQARVQQLSEESELGDLLKAHGRAVLYFRAEWAPPCKQMDVVFETLRQTHNSLGGDDEASGLFLRIDADTCKATSKHYNVTRVPAFFFLVSNRVVRRIDGADASALSRAARWLSDTSDDVSLTSACEYLTKRSEIMLFLKGTPSLPRCAFGRRMVETLRKAGVNFDSFDVTTDVGVRERIKEVALWETYPLLYAQGRVIGGIDKVEKLADEHRLISELARKEGDPECPIGADKNADSPKTQDMNVMQPGEGQTLEDRLRALTKQQKVMLFMKGSPDQPRCGFSRTMVQLLNQHGLSYGTFDILSDEEVRQGLKKFSNWPTYPQLYSNGQLVGGLDVVKELVATGELATELDV